MSDNGYLLEMNDITVEFPGVKALDKVKFNAKRGEVHVLLGENGAGNSIILYFYTCAFFQFVIEFPGCLGDNSPDQCWSWTTQDKKQVDCRLKPQGPSLRLLFLLTALSPWTGYKHNAFSSLSA